MLASAFFAPPPLSVLRLAVLSFGPRLSSVFVRLFWAEPLMSTSLRSALEMGPLLETPLETLQISPFCFYTLHWASPASTGFGTSLTLQPRTSLGLGYGSVPVFFGQTGFLPGRPFSATNVTCRVPRSACTKTHVRDPPRHLPRRGPLPLFLKAHAYMLVEHRHLIFYTSKSLWF